ncbi:helix-turn-helix transcriptional regulator [Spirillospora sp. NPDC050679]
MLETSVRLLRLLSLLQARPEWPGPELADRLEVTSRTVRNDIERLRLLGYRIDSTSGPAGGYRLGAGAALPPLILDDEEAVAVAVGLHAAASGTVTGIEETSLRALAKLQHLLPSRLRHRIEAVRAATLSVSVPGPTVDVATLTAVSAAVRDHERLRFDYRGRDGTGSVREVEPHRLVYTGRRWYLLAWDVARGDWRTFRADRISPRAPNGPRFAPRTPPDGGAVAHVLSGTGSRAWRHQARIRLHAPVEEITERLPPEAGLVHDEDGRSCVLETGSDSLRDLVAYLTRLDVAFTALDPPELRDLLRTLADRYRDAADAG